MAAITVPSVTHLAGLVASWLRLVVLLMLLASLAILLARSLGIVLPIRTLGHVELAYAAGAYWLTR